MSDIDFTLILHETINPKIARRIKRRFNWLKRLIPIIGECNIYDRLAIGPLAILANPFEVARDPFLSSKIKTESNSLLVQKLIFLQRLFKGDQKNLRFKLNKRFRKLSYCFDLLDPKRALVPHDVASLDFLVRYLKENVIEEAGWEFLDYLVLKILQVEQENNTYENIWNIEKLDSRRLSNISALQREMLLINISWEFWGLYSQIAFEKDHRFATNYLLIQKTNFLGLCENQKVDANSLQAMDLVIEQFQNFIDEY